jgi:hypothetical protein
MVPQTPMSPSTPPFEDIASVSREIIESETTSKIITPTTEIAA